VQYREKETQHNSRNTIPTAIKGNQAFTKLSFLMATAGKAAFQATKYISCLLVGVDQTAPISVVTTQTTTIAEPN